MARPKKAVTKLKRLQVPMEPATMREVAELKEALGAPSMSSVVRDALSLYGALQRMLQDKQHQLALIDDATGFVQTLYIPTLMHDTPIIAVDGPMEKAGKKR